MMPPRGAILSGTAIRAVIGGNVYRTLQAVWVSP